MKKVLYLSLSTCILVLSCKKSEDVQPLPSAENSELVFTITHAVDGVDLLADTILYVNDAGNQYSVNRLWYYLSQIALIRSDSSLLPVKDYQFIDAFNAGNLSFTVPSVVQGDYIGLAFYIGLDSALNQTNALPALVENLNMEWPVAMGGGYHFMKLEGHYHQNDSLFGYAIHLGRNEALVTCRLYSPISLRAGRATIRMRMNLNEWYRSPQIYDFNVDGNYSMGNMQAMSKLARNGSDVFTLY